MLNFAGGFVAPSFESIQIFTDKLGLDIDKKKTADTEGVVQILMMLCFGR